MAKRLHRGPEGDGRKVHRPSEAGHVTLEFEVMVLIVISTALVAGWAAFVGHAKLPRWVALTGFGCALLGPLALSLLLNLVDHLRNPRPQSLDSGGSGTFEDPHSRGGWHLVVLTGTAAAWGVGCAAMDWPMWMCIGGLVAGVLAVIAGVWVVGKFSRARLLRLARIRLPGVACLSCGRVLGEVTDIKYGPFPQSVVASCPSCGTEATYSVDPKKAPDGNPLQ